MLKRAFIIIMVFHLFCNFSCSIFKISSENDLEILPRETEVPGWKIELPPKRYTRSDINEYLKGTTTQYEKYDFRELIVAGYISVDNSSMKISAEIYRMSSPLNAFGILSYERGFNHKDAKICGNSYSTPKGFFARKGAYYIRIIANKEYENALDDFTVFAQLICNNIKIEKEVMPDYLSLFGNNGLKDLVYRIDEYPAFPELRNFFVRRTKISGKKRSIFFAKRDSRYDSFQEFSNLLKDKDNPFILSSTEEMQIAFQEKGNRGFTFISVYSEWIFGIISANSMTEGKKIINFLYEDLLEFLNGN